MTRHARLYRSLPNASLEGLHFESTLWPGLRAACVALGVWAHPNTLLVHTEQPRRRFEPTLRRESHCEEHGRHSSTADKEDDHDRAQAVVYARDLDGLVRQADALPIEPRLCRVCACAPTARVKSCRDSTIRAFKGGGYDAGAPSRVPFGEKR